MTRSRKFKQLDGDIGPTGEGEGTFQADDKGGLTFAVGNRDGRVVLEFGTPVTRMAAEPEQAEALAFQLLKHATDVRRQRTLAANIKNKA